MAAVQSVCWAASTVPVHMRLHVHGLAKPSRYVKRASSRGGDAHDPNPRIHASQARAPAAPPRTRQRASPASLHINCLLVAMRRQPTIRPSSRPSGEGARGGCPPPHVGWAVARFPGISASAEWPELSLPAVTTHFPFRAILNYACSFVQPNLPTLLLLPSPRAAPADERSRPAQATGPATPAEEIRRGRRRRRSGTGWCIHPSIHTFIPRDVSGRAAFERHLLVLFVLSLRAAAARIMFPVDARSRAGSRTSLGR